MSTNGGPVNLIHIRNPWGTERGVWKGAWSEGSDKWNSVPKTVEMSVAGNQGNGEFWMSLADYNRNFATTNICCLTPDCSDETTEDLGLGQFHGLLEIDDDFGRPRTRPVYLFAFSARSQIRFNVTDCFIRVN